MYLDEAKSIQCHVILRGGVRREGECCNNARGARTCKCGRDAVFISATDCVFKRSHVVLVTV